MRQPRWIGAVLAAAVGILPMAPPEHVHEVEERGHHLLLVHRHPDSHAAADASHHRESVFDHSEAPSATVDAAYLAPPIAHLEAPVVKGGPVIEPPKQPATLRTPEYVEHLIHGPPRAPAALRAPPSASRL